MTSQPLKLGIIGLSEGNGHPYSWSAICNGYDAAKIQSGAFPNITAYLARRKFPADQLAAACVTHVYTQDENLSRHIAESCNIQNVAKKPEDFIGEVDAVLLARDDHENHLKFAQPFIDASLPIFIDKPLAVSVKAAEEFFAMEKYEGQIFTCSALRYADEFFLNDEEKSKIGKLTRIEGVTPKSWDKYAIHLIEPVIRLYAPNLKATSIQKTASGEETTLKVTWANAPETIFTAKGPSVKQGTITLIYTGEKGTLEKPFSNPFDAFKSALSRFIHAAHARKAGIPRAETLKTIELIEAGLK